jgi:hypothetical protein
MIDTCDKLLYVFKAALRAASAGPKPRAGRAAAPLPGRAAATAHKHKGLRDHTVPKAEHN